ncbi:hypothetical protein K501DRAFT_32795 [Backusella circina FSU 941]|nr:hypothetical protein K501DRAFT_32795 [Backusella circina FSU 941]
MILKIYNMRFYIELGNLGVKFRFFALVQISIIFIYSLFFFFFFFFPSGCQKKKNRISICKVHNM